MAIKAEKAFGHLLREKVIVMMRGQAPRRGYYSRREGKSLLHFPF
jgi:hypothetical protein